MALTAAQRQRRSRAHRAGDHSLCDPSRCLDAPDAPVTPSVTVTCDLASALRTGTRRKQLEAIRDHLADLFVDERDPRDAATLSRELRALLAELDGLSEGTAKESILDELAQARAERQQKAAGQ